MLRYSSSRRLLRSTTPTTTAISISSPTLPTSCSYHYAHRQNSHNDSTTITPPIITTFIHHNNSSSSHRLYHSSHTHHHSHHKKSPPSSSSNNNHNNNNNNSQNNNNNNANGGKSKKALNTKASVAQRLFDEQKWNESLDLFNQVLQIDPDHVQSLCFRSKIHVLHHRYHEALTDSMRAHTVDTNYALLNDLFDVQAGLMHRLAKFDDLLFYANQMTDYAKRAQHSYFLASCLRYMAIAIIKRFMRCGEYESALKFIDERVVAGVDHFNEVHELMHLKCQLLLRLERFELANEVAQQYLKGECPVTTFYHIYAQSSHYLGDRSLAKEVLSLWGQLIDEDQAVSSLQYHCHRVEYQYTKAKIFAMQGHIASVDMYRSAIKSAREEQLLEFVPEILVDMALAKNLFGLKEEAKKDLEEALTHVPNHLVYSKLTL